MKSSSKDQEKSLVAKRYHLQRKLGEGGMGVVYLAKDSLHVGSPRERVALKFLHEGEDDEHVRRFKQEFEILSQVKHPFLASVYDFGFDRSRKVYFFTSEFIEGDRFDEAAGGLNLTDQLILFSELLQALAYVHRQGILHNDLKPSNILVSGGHIRLLDFGIAAVLGNLGGKSSRSRAGTPGFMAPELMEGESPSVASDLFALGVVFHHVLTGAMPDGTSLSKNKSRTNLPKKLCALVDRMLSASPSSRPASADQALSVISRLTGRPVVPDAEPSLLAQSPFVGRELVTEQVLHNMESSQHPFVLVRGERGMGRSRFLQEMAVRLQLRDLIIAIGVAGIGERRTFSPFDQILRQLLNEQEASEVLVELFLRGESQALAIESGESGVGINLRAYHLFLNYLRSLTAQRKVILAVDDLELVEPSGLELLSFLLRARLPNLTVLATVRDPMEDSIQSFHLEHGGSVHALAPLSEPDIDLTACSMVGRRSMPEEFLEEVRRISAGNPERLVSAVQDWVRIGLLTRSQMGWALSNDFSKRVRKYSPEEGGLPQWADLDSDRRDLLQAALLFSRAIPLAEISAVLSVSEMQMANRLRFEVQQGLLQQLGSRTFVWSSSRHRSVLAETLLRSAKGQKILMTLHRRLAEVLSAESVTEHPYSWERAAFHAEAADDRAMAARCALRVSQVYLENNAYPQTERSLGITRRFESFLSSEERRAALRVQILLAQRRGQFQESMILITEALRDSSLPEPLRCEYVLEKAIALKRQGSLAESLHFLNENLAWMEAKGPSAIAAAFLVQRAMVGGALGKREESFPFIERALKHVSEKSDPLLYASICNGRGSSKLNWMNDAQGALLDFQEALRVFQTIGNFRGQATATHNVAVALYRQGKTKEYAAYLETALDLARRVGDVQRLLPILESLGFLALLSLDFGKSTHLLHEGADTAALIQERARETAFLLQRAKLSGLHGHFEEALAFCTKARALGVAIGDQRLVALTLLEEGSVHLAIGDLDAADRTLASIAPEVLAKDMVVTGFFRLLRADGKLSRADYGGVKEELEQARSAFTSIDLPMQQLEVDLQQIRLATAEENDIDLGLLKDVHSRLQGVRVQGNYLQWLLGSVILWEYADHRGTDLAIAEIEAATAQFHAQIASMPEVAIRIELLLASEDRRRGRIEAMLDHLLRAESVVREVGSALSPALRAAYVKDPRRERVRQALRQEQQTEGAVRIEAQRLQSELDSHLGLFSFCIDEMIRSRDLPNLLTVLCRYVRELLDAEEVVFLREDTKGFSVVAGATMSGQEPTLTGKESVSGKRQSAFAQKALEEGDQSGEEMTAISFFRQDQSIGASGEAAAVPIGVLLLVADRVHRIEPQRRVLNNLIRFLRALLPRFLSWEEAVQKSERSTSALSLTRHTLAEQQRTQQLAYNYDRLIGGRSSSMRAVFQMLDRVVPSAAPVLIEGESGTGKEMVAQSIHTLGPLAARPLVSINCGALSPQILESQLFGHVKGAFTGAVEDQLGLLVAADGGTVFLDEIGEMPLDMQVKLLRVLEDGEVRPVGSTQVRKARFRILSATNRSLEEMVEEGSFRKDLFYRLNVIVIRIPPLRERREDILDLVQFFLKKIAEQTGERQKSITARALKTLTYASWPGNVRQLENVLEMVVTLTSSRRIDVADLPKELQGGGQSAGSGEVLPVEEAKRRFMREYLDLVLDRSGGRVAEAARLAGIHRESFHRLMRKHKKD